MRTAHLAPSNHTHPPALLHPAAEQDPKACSIVLRGASKDVLNEVERNLHDAMGVARNVCIGGCPTTCGVRPAWDLAVGVATCAVATG